MSDEKKEQYGYTTTGVAMSDEKKEQYGDAEHLIGKLKPSLDAMRFIEKLRHSLSEFIALHYDDHSKLSDHCMDNGWDDGISYELKDAMLKLSGVASTLYVWEDMLRDEIPSDGSTRNAD